MARPSCVYMYVASHTHMYCRYCCLQVQNFAIFNSLNCAKISTESDNAWLEGLGAGLTVKHTVKC